MPEIKNTFLKGKMNKDLDERLVPNGEYRDALNIKVSTSEESEVGTIQTILGNERVDSLVPSDHICVGSVADEKTNKLYWFTKTSSLDLILEYDQNNDTSSYVFVDIKTNTDDAVLKFPDKLITGINIIDGLLFWTDGVTEPKKINIKNCIDGTVQDPLIALTNHTKLIVQGAVVLDSAGNQVDIKEENITVIKKKPTKAPVANILYQQTSPTNNDKDSLFEKTFSRFSLRYKYQDGEYSAFGPFSNVVFNPQYIENDNFNQNIVAAKEENYTRKEPFNRAMVNKIETIEIHDFVSPEMPKDVVEIEILYKQEDSPVVYSIAKLNRNDVTWTYSGYNEGTAFTSSEYLGRYDILTENIYAALPENQFIRVFDNVPKYALAQEVTGNRIVYGNYTQNYDVNRSEYSHIVSYATRLDTDIPNFEKDSFDFSPQKSLKSLRNYQVGIVFGDKYGRETPVFTTENAASYIPWEDQGSYNASRKLSLIVDYGGNAPTWAEYFKYYIKETSTEYYNLIMDKAFIPTSQDDIDRNLPSDHIWLSFFSSDRNKLQEEDHIILKKIFAGTNSQVTKNNKFKVIDIKNEAPDSIQFDQKRLFIETDQTDLDNIFSISGKSITNEVNEIEFDKASYDSTGGYDFLSTDKEDFKITDHYLNWKDATTNQFSRKYRIDNVVESGNNLIIKLNRSIDNADATLAAVGGVIGAGIQANLQFEVERKQRRELDQFSGRFFVKIAFNNLASDIQNIIPDISIAFTSISSGTLRHLINEIDPANTNPSQVAVNTSPDSAESYNNAAAGTINNLDVYDGVTNTQTGWNTIMSEISDGTNAPEFFIDSMYYCAGNWGGDSEPYAKRAIDIQRGTSDGGDPTYYTYTIWTDEISEEDHLPWQVDLFGAQYNNTGKSKKNYYPYGKYTNNAVGPHSHFSNTNTNAADGQFISYSLPDGINNSGPNYTTGSNGFGNAPDERPGIDMASYSTYSTINHPSGTALYTHVAGATNGEISTNWDALPPKRRHFPLDRDAFTEGSWDCTDAYFNTTATPARYFVINSHPDSSNNAGTNVTQPLRYFNKTVTQGVTTPGPDLFYYGYNSSGSGISNENDTVNSMEGFIESTTEHTTGSRAWVAPSSQTSGSVANLASTGWQQDSTYGNTGDEGKFYLHISFLGPGNDLTNNNFALPNDLRIQGANSLGDHLQGIHGGGVFTKTFKESVDDGGDGFDNTNNWDSPRTIHCEYSTVNGSTPDKGYDSSFSNRHQDQWDPTKTPFGDPNGEIAAFISQLKTPNAKFIFQSDPNSIQYTIKSCRTKYLYNHTPWRRRYVRDIGGSASGIYTDNRNLNGDNIGADDSVEETAVTWAKSKASNASAATQTTNRDNLSQKIQDFGKRNNRRVVYILEIDKNISQNSVNNGFNPLDADTTGSNISASNGGNIEFIDTAGNFTQGSSSIFPAIWETEPKKNTDLDIYYEASKAIPLKINSFNRETLGTIGSQVTSSKGTTAISTGTIVNVSNWREDNGEQIVVLSPGLKSLDGANQPIDYNGSFLTFISRDTSFVNAEVISSTLTAPAAGGFFTEFSIKLNKPTNKIGLSWYNCFSFNNGIESNRIRDDFNQMQIINGARASAVLEEPYSVEEKKNSLIYSGIYNSTSNTNNLNQFIAGEKITKDLNPTYGSIQKLFQRRISLVAFCEDKVVSIVSNKDALFNADGNSQLVSTNKVLGDATPFVGDYGISKNPESFASESYRAYFTDKNRGAVLRLSKDGITPISQAGMHDWFRDNLPLANSILGSYDEYNQDYNLSLIVNLPEYNLIQNSLFNVGENYEFIAAGSEKSFNGAMNSSTNSNFPNALPWQSDNTFSNSDSSGMGIQNQNLESITEITQYKAIPAGSFQAVNNSGANNPGSGLPGDPGLPAQSFVEADYSNENTDSYGGSLSNYIYKWPGDSASQINNIFMPNAHPDDSNYELGNGGDHEAYVKSYIGSLGIFNEQGASSTLQYYSNASSTTPEPGFVGTQLARIYARASGVTNIKGITVDGYLDPADGRFKNIGSVFNNSAIFLQSRGDSTNSLAQGPGRVVDSLESPSGYNMGDPVRSAYNGYAHTEMINDVNVTNSDATDVCVFAGEVIIVEYELIVYHRIVNHLNSPNNITNLTSITAADVYNNYSLNGAFVYDYDTNSAIDSGTGTYDNPNPGFPINNFGFGGADRMGDGTMTVKLYDGDNFSIPASNSFNSIGGELSNYTGSLTGNEAWYESYGDSANNTGHYWITDKSAADVQWYKHITGKLYAKVRHVFKIPELPDSPNQPDPTIDDYIVTKNLKVGLKYAPGNGSMSLLPGHPLVGANPATSTWCERYTINNLHVYKASSLTDMHENSTTGTLAIPATPAIPAVTIPEFYQVKSYLPDWSTDKPMYDANGNMNLLANNDPEGADLTSEATKEFGVSRINVPPTDSATDVGGNVWQWYIDSNVNSDATLGQKTDGTPYTANDIYKIVDRANGSIPGNPEDSFTTPGNQTILNDAISIPSKFNPIFQIFQSLQNPYIVEHFYLFDVETENDDATVFPQIPNGNWSMTQVSIRGHMGPSNVGVTTAVVGDLCGANGFPYHSFGVIRGSGSQFRTAACVSINPTKDAMTDPGTVYCKGEVAGVDAPFLHSLFNLGYSSNAHVLRSIIKVDTDSYMATNNQLGSLRIKLGTDFSNSLDFSEASGEYGRITSIKLVDLGEDANPTFTSTAANPFIHTSVGNVNDFVFSKKVNYVNHKMVTPGMYVSSNKWNVNNLSQNILFNQGLSTLSQVNTYKHLSQRYANPGGAAPNEVADEAPIATLSGYTLQFDISDEYLLNNHGVVTPNTGVLAGYVIGVNGKGFSFSGLTAPGRYKVIGNVGDDTDPTPDGTPFSIEYDPLFGNSFSPPPTGSVSTKDASNIAPGNFGRFYGAIYFGCGADVNGKIRLSVSNVSLLDSSVYFIPPSSPSWSFVNNNGSPNNGFDWINGSLIMNATNFDTTLPVTTPQLTVLNSPVHAVQEVGHIPTGQNVRFSFDWEELGNTNGQVTMVYVNNEGNGFMVSGGSYTSAIGGATSGQNFRQDLWSLGGSGTFSFDVEIAPFLGTHPLANAVVPSASFPAGINRLTIYTDSTYGTGSQSPYFNAFQSGIGMYTANYSFDNFSLVPFTPIDLSLNKTITYSEDVGGWVSFKSFDPESALSLSKKYYTFKQGGLYQHHVNTNGYNNFYDVQFDSSITAILNTNPSVIKSFKTLGYEGSQSHVTAFNEALFTYTDSNGNVVNTTVDTFNYNHHNNITQKQGWYVQNIFTNKQDGFVDEFIEKEGKWFNYIKGGIQTISQDYISKHTGDLSFQGIGEIQTVQDITLVSPDPSDIGATSAPVPTVNPNLVTVTPPAQTTPATPGYTSPSGTPGGGGTTIY